MLFAVKPQSGNSIRIRRYPHVILSRDSWDDYGYKTSFDVTLHISAHKKIDLGIVKILKIDQESGFTSMPRGTFEGLDERYASVGTSLRYYERLHSSGLAIYRPYLTGLRDIAFVEEAHTAIDALEGYRVSLLRFSGAETTIAQAAILLRSAKHGRRQEGLAFSVRFRTRVADNATPITVQFDFGGDDVLPNRINALIGYNGTGKTRLLSNLAIVASGYGYANKEDHLKRAAGRFIGDLPPFKTVVVISYSAFDTFVIPGRTDAEKEVLQERGEIFGYVYCGLRELVEDESFFQSYRLRTPSEVEDDFVAALVRVRTAQRIDALEDVLRPLFEDPSFRRIGLKGEFIRNRRTARSIFRSLSSGHKVVLKIIAELTAHIAGTEPTLVLIDEPETHLHPPLLAAFLKSVRICLERFDGYAVISTHSPVVLQETPSKYVQILRRSADRNSIAPSEIETFGESISIITQEVFNLGDGTGDWHDVLRNLSRDYTIEEIERMFDRKLGFSARSYVLSLRDEGDE